MALRKLRAELLVWGYNKSYLLKFTEEFLAETFGTGKPLYSIQFAYGYLPPGIKSVGRLLAEGAIVGGHNIKSYMIIRDLSEQINF